jgi:hypothetical protein
MEISSFILRDEFPKNFHEFFGKTVYIYTFKLFRHQSFPHRRFTMRSRSIGLGFAFLGALVLCSCDPKQEALPKDTVPIDTTITYTLHIAPLLATHCDICHISAVSGGAEFTTYEKVKSLIDRIIARTSNGSMPPSGSGKTPLTASQVDTLKIWEASGVRQ